MYGEIALIMASSRAAGEIHHIPVYTYIVIIFEFVDKMCLNKNYNFILKINLVNSFHLGLSVV